MSQLTRYTGMNFPAYEYKEYPKWVKLSDGKEIVVQNEFEEREALGESVPAPVMEVPAIAAWAVEVPPVEFPVAEFPSSESNEKTALIARADELGAIYDKRWGITKLKDAIQAAEEDIESVE